MDKTATLTEGKPHLTSVVALPGQDEATLLRLAASLERGSEHPLAAAIVRGANVRGLVLSKVQDFRSITGKGVIGTAEGQSVALGNRALLEELDIDAGTLAAPAEALRREGQTVMFVAINGRAAGLVGVGLLLSPIFASAAMTFSSVSVIANALRLRKLAL